MLKFIIPVITLSILLHSCTTDNNFQIVGSVTGFDDNYILLIDNGNTDTINISDHTFNYSGNIDSVRLAYLQLPSYPKKHDFIIEPGAIEVSYESKKEFFVSGTPTNNAYTEYKRGMDEATTKVMEGYQVYMKVETKEAQDEAMSKYDQLEEDRRVFMRAQLRKNPNIVGIMIMKPIYRTDSIQNLAEYLELLVEFSYTDIYQEVDAYNTAINSTLPGMPVPDFALPDSSGNQIEMESFRGQYVLLDFWFTGCTYCDMLVPHMKNIYADFHDQGFEIIDISVDKEKDKWLGTVIKKNSPWIHLHDAEKKVSSSFAMPGFPTLILIDKEGKIAERLVGYREEAQLREEILSAMDK